MSASSSLIAKNRAGILGVSRLAQTIFLMAGSADPWRTADGLRFGRRSQWDFGAIPHGGNPDEPVIEQFSGEGCSESVP